MVKVLKVMTEQNKAVEITALIDNISLKKSLFEILLSSIKILFNYANN